MSVHFTAPWRLPILSILALLTAIITPPASAQTVLTDAERIVNGLEKAKLWCAHCHVVEPNSGTVAQSDVPSFTGIAARPDQTLEKTENGILDPHPPMPDLQLSRDQVRDLSLYIMSLRP